MTHHTGWSQHIAMFLEFASVANLASNRSIDIRCALSTKFTIVGTCLFGVLSSQAINARIGCASFGDR
jgi:hypothetical protein